MKDSLAILQSSRHMNLDEFSTSTTDKSFWDSKEQRSRNCVLVICLMLVCTWKSVQRSWKRISANKKESDDTLKIKRVSFTVL